MEKINGFNESYETPSIGEDTDVDRRFQLIGLQTRSVKNAAVCYHQYHPLVPRTGGGEKLRDMIKRDRNTTCARGLKEHGDRHASGATNG